MHSGRTEEGYEIEFPWIKTEGALYHAERERERTRQRDWRGKKKKRRRSRVGGRNAESAAISLLFSFFCCECNDGALISQICVL